MNPEPVEGGVIMFRNLLVCGVLLSAAAVIAVAGQPRLPTDEALARADVIVVLWSRQSVQSDWVCDEAAQGRDRHRLVPLSLDGALPPLGFRQIQAVDVSHWNGRANAQQLPPCGAQSQPRLARRRGRCREFASRPFHGGS